MHRNVTILFLSSLFPVCYCSAFLHLSCHQYYMCSPLSRSVVPTFSSEPSVELQTHVEELSSFQHSKYNNQVISQSRHSFHVFKRLAYIMQKRMVSSQFPSPISGNKRKASSCVTCITLGLAQVASAYVLMIYLKLCHTDKECIHILHNTHCTEHAHHTWPMLYANLIIIS